MKLLKSLGNTFFFIAQLLLAALAISLPLLAALAIGKFLLAYLGTGAFALTIGVAFLVLLIGLTGSDKN